MKVWDTDDMIATLEQENRQLRARNERLEEEAKLKCNPMNGDQVLRLWRESNGHVLRFAALLESFHGIGGMDAAS